MYLKLQNIGVGATRRRHRSLGEKLFDLLKWDFSILLPHFLPFLKGIDNMHTTLTYYR